MSGLDGLAPAVVGFAASWWAYTYVVYPLALACLARQRQQAPPDPARWPPITITMVAHNAAKTIAATIEHTLALDYPASRREVVVVSDGSTDATNAIVRSFSDRGVELVQIRDRGGKTEAENIAAPMLRGEIIVNTDASVRLDADALKALVRAFADPTVGLASGRDVSVPPQQASDGATRTRAEGAYVGYEMWVRDLETRLGGIVGASGCLYATRPEVQRWDLPGGVARDFAAPLIARGLDLRAVSVRDAVCFVPRSTGLASEFQRKRRTIVRGLATLRLAPELLGGWPGVAFAWMLLSHKAARWLAPWWALAAAVALLSMAISAGWIMPMVAALVTLGLVALTPVGAPLAYVVAGTAAVFAAWIAYARGINPPVWEPTRR